MKHCDKWQIVFLVIWWVFFALLVYISVRQNIEINERTSPHSIQKKVELEVKKAVDNLPAVPAGKDGNDGAPGGEGPRGDKGEKGDTVVGPKGDQGEAGKSAFQIWLDQGNVGDEQDFLDSLKGADGLLIEGCTTLSGKPGTRVVGTSTCKANKP